MKIFNQYRSGRLREMVKMRCKDGEIAVSLLYISVFVE